MKPPLSVSVKRSASNAVIKRLARCMFPKPGPRSQLAPEPPPPPRPAVLSEQGDLSGSKALTEQAIALKEKELGKHHPDVGISLQNLAWTYSELGQPREALAAASRSVEILERYGDPDTEVLGQSYHDRGRALFALGRTEEAGVAFAEARRILRANLDWASPDLADALQGLAEVKIVQHKPAEAIALLEESLNIRAKSEQRSTQLAAARFALARALWESGGDRKRARALASSAHETYASYGRSDKQRAVAEWLAANGGVVKP